MKNFFIIFCIFNSTNCIAKFTKHQVGIGLGSAIFRPKLIDFNSPAFQLQSIFFNTDEGDFLIKKISVIQLPYFYYSYQLNKNLALRCNGNFRNYISFEDFTGVTVDPIPFPGKQYYYQHNSLKTINVNIGMQYKKTIENISFYGVAEFAPHLYRNIATNYFVSNANPNISQMEVLKKNRWDLYSFNLLGGVQYQLTKHLSVCYEGGIYNTFISPLSRISLNVEF
jgi:hypothetical protein